MRLEDKKNGRLDPGNIEWGGGGGEMMGHVGKYVIPFRLRLASRRIPKSWTFEPLVSADNGILLYSLRSIFQESLVRP